MGAPWEPLVASHPESPLLFIFFFSAWAGRSEEVTPSLVRYLSVETLRCRPSHEGNRVGDLRILKDPPLPNGQARKQANKQKNERTDEQRNEQTNRQTDERTNTQRMNDRLNEWAGGNRRCVAPGGNIRRPTGVTAPERGDRVSGAIVRHEAPEREKRGGRITHPRSFRAARAPLHLAMTGRAQPEPGSWGHIEGRRCYLRTSAPEGRGHLTDKSAPRLKKRCAVIPSRV